MVTKVDERMLTSNRQEYHADKRVKFVSSRHFTAAHTIRYGKGDEPMSDEIIPFLSKQCMTQSGYDFAKAEARLIDHYLARVPALDTEMRVFTFAHEQHASGVLTSFKQKVKQTALAPEVSEAIKREIGSATRASAILEVMETVRLESRQTDTQLSLQPRAIALVSSVP